MATYKQPCIHCGEMIERDSRYCSRCESHSPFGDHCPNCLKEIVRGNAVCSGCGRNLTVLCPYCGGATFAGSERCDACGRSVMILCENKKCGRPQFFENTSCNICGKKIKKAQKQIAAAKQL